MNFFEPDFSDLVELGRGAQGAVFRARQSSLDRLVVLKSQYYSNKKLKNSIIDQNRRLSTITFSGVPKIYQVFSRNNRVWTAMEWFEGITLSSVQSLSNWTFQLRLYIAVEIIKIIADIHKNNWTHGDLKPSNVLLTKQGEIKIVDLGFAVLKSGNDDKQDDIKGTPVYMAPELMLTEQSDPIKADLYALGMVLHEIFAGKRPAKDNRTQKILVQAIPSVPESINSIVFKCLEYSPNDRPQSAKLLLEQIENETEPSGSDLHEQLSSRIDPLYRAHISKCCTATARDLKRKDPKRAYKLVCEAVELDPDNKNAIDLLENLPSDISIKKTAYFKKVITLALLIIAVIGTLVSKLFFTEKDSLDSADIPFKNEKEYIGNVPEKKESRLSKKPLFNLTESRETAEGEMLIRGIPEKAKLFIDEKFFEHNGDGLNLKLKSGEHILKINRDSVNLWEKNIRVLPFQKFEIDLSKGNLEK